MPRAHEQRDDLSHGSPGLARIQARKLRAGYGPRVVLHDLDFLIPAGNLTVVLGPGGSGKSTLLQALGCRGHEPADFWRKGELEVPSVLGVLPQHLKVREATPAHLLARTSALDRSPRGALEELWSGVPQAQELLAPLLHTKMSEMSHSDARLVQLTLAFNQGGALLLDEPDARLGDREQEWICRQLEVLRGTRTIVLATHHLKIARRLADFLLLLVDGELLECGTAQPIFTESTRPRTVHFLEMGS